MRQSQWALLPVPPVKRGWANFAVIGTAQFGCDRDAKTSVDIFDDDNQLSSTAFDTNGVRLRLRIGDRILLGVDLLFIDHFFGKDAIDFGQIELQCGCVDSLCIGSHQTLAVSGKNWKLPPETSVTSCKRCAIGVITHGYSVDNWHL